MTGKIVARPRRPCYGPGQPGLFVRPFSSPVTASRGGALSIVLLAILAVMWVAFLLPVIAPRQRRGGWVRRRLGAADDTGWRPSPELSTRGALCSTAAGAGNLRLGPGRARGGSPTAGRSVLRRRRVLLALTLVAAASIRVRYVLGGHWWIAEAVAGALLGAYVVALVVQGFRRRHPARPALPAPPARRALPPPPRRTVMATPPPAPPRPEPTGRRGLRRRRQADGPLWGAPLLEGQGPPTPE